MSVAEWTDTQSIHHWTILGSSYRNLAWIEFESTTTDFHSDALTNGAISRELNLHLEPTLYSYSNFFVVQCHNSQFRFVLDCTVHWQVCTDCFFVYSFHEFYHRLAIFHCLTFWCFTKFSFHHKWNEARLLVTKVL